MTTDTRPLDRLAQDWAARAHSEASRDALRALELAEPEVAQAGAADLGDLVEVLIGASPAAWQTRDGRDRDRAASLFRAMLRSGSAHAMVSRALVQALVPGLVGVARRLTWGRGGEWDSQGAFVTDMIATAWEVLEEWTGQDRTYAVLDVLSAVRCRLRRRIRRHHDLQISERLVRDDERSPERPSERIASGGSDVEELARTIERERRRLDAGDAAVLYAHRVLGYSLSELSARSGHSRRFLAMRRDRAVSALTA
ncbi:MAG TPA: hypothetical protein VMD28_07960 [Acidimicrobiales bacterium]|nr:hypothetical protein [Acidimicrobiales bacterium]